MNKKKILNDPVYGFITIPNELVFDIIEHRFFQRLRRIKQLGLSDYVYPGALHTRFQHALGAMHLMSSAIKSLQEKGIEVSTEEENGAILAILLHDLGHGPFSHTLEFSLFQNVQHEQVSLWMMNQLNEEFDGALNLAISIFKGQYHRTFFNQLVSSQLDVDRLDYLKRDSFFTGVYEGSIGSSRLIKMLNVVGDQLVVEEKGIYSIESFLSARRMMYWQVYLHKTAVSAEAMLMLAIKRAKELIRNGEKVLATPALSTFLEKEITASDFNSDRDILNVYARLDDNDVWAALKFWQDHSDFVLRSLSRDILERNLFRITFANHKTGDLEISSLLSKVQNSYGISSKESEYFVKQGIVSNSAYLPSSQFINVLKKTGEVLDVAEATDLPNIKAMSQVVTKHFICAPKSIL